MAKTLLSALIVATLAAIGSFGMPTPTEAQTCGTVNLEAGPITNNKEAQNKCPDACGNRGYTWNGNWETTVQNKMSVCSCVPQTAELEAGPIFSQSEAEKKCSNTCQNKGRSWNGQWATTVPQKMSVCSCSCTG